MKISAVIILSNGHSKFILGPAAAEVYRRGLLMGFITGGYPTARVRRSTHFLKLDTLAPVKRLLQRQENIPDALVHSLWSSEIVGQFNRVIGMIAGKPGGVEWIEDYALRLYAWQARRIVCSLPVKVYHYRSGYGHESVRIAKEKGAITLCDHSIAHPAALAYLVSHGGALPPPQQTDHLTRMWRNILKDINQADFVLANSDFAKRTFIHEGYDPSKIFVLYTGIDERFLDLIPQRAYRPSNGPVRLLFAGDLGARKGGEILLHALLRIRDLPWQFETVGSIEPKLRHSFRGLLADQRVVVSGFLPLKELAQRMSTADIFVFPSLAEGSARVIFMAMACGCYVITTPNSGSIVQDGTHGRIVAPGNVSALETALRESIQTPERIASVGRSNAELIRSRYTQDDYGRGLLAVYRALAIEKPDIAEAQK